MKKPINKKQMCLPNLKIPDACMDSYCGGIQGHTILASLSFKIVTILWKKTISIKLITKSVAQAQTREKKTQKISSVAWKKENLNF